MLVNHLVLPSGLVCSRLDFTPLEDGDSISATEVKRNYFRCNFNQTVGYKKIRC